MINLFATNIIKTFNMEETRGRKRNPASMRQQIATLGKLRLAKFPIERMDTARATAYSVARKNNCSYISRVDRKNNLIIIKRIE